MEPETLDAQRLLLSHLVTDSPDSNGDAKILSMLERSYKETLDATKHQDDKIGRLFTGVSFLTAAALATANLGGSSYLSQRYIEFAVPMGVVCLASYLVLVVLCVMLLINSLATPLRVPGLARNRAVPNIDYVGDPKVESSQIYFGEIAKVGLGEWNRKWHSEPAALETELRQSLINETHNLAVRTHFKYSRTTEAIVVYNFALLFLVLTVGFCVTAAVAKDDTPVGLPDWSRWLLASAFGLYFFVQLQGQIRYARQTVDELYGPENRLGAVLKYIWAASASAWSVLLASGYSNSTGWLIALVFLLLIVAAITLGFGTRAYSRQRSARARDKGVKDEKTPLAWFGLCVAVVVGLALTVTSVSVPEYGVAFVCAIGAAGLLSLYSLVLPSISHYRNGHRFAAREEQRNSTTSSSSSPSA